MEGGENDMKLNLVHPDFKDARNFTEILEQTATSFLMRIEYPDGVIVLIKTVGGESFVSCSHELIENGTNVTIDTSIQNDNFVDVEKNEDSFKPIHLNHSVVIPTNSEVAFLTDTGENKPSKTVFLENGNYLLMFKNHLVNSIVENGSDTLLRSDAPLQKIEEGAKILIRIGHF